MKVVVIGASGTVGKAFMKELCRTGIISLGTYYKRKQDTLSYLDMTDKDATFQFLTKQRPEIVIQTAYQPNVDYCEDHREEVWRTNVLGTEDVAKACEASDAKHVFISTDYVFDGTAGPYSEEDPVNPIDYYALTKVESEKRVRSLSDYLIIRTGVIFDADPESKNFALRVVNELSAGRGMKVPIDQFGNPTLASNLAACVMELATRDKVGIYNVAGSTIMPRFDFAKLICDKFKLDSSLIRPVKSEELNQKAKRPKRLGLIVDKASKELTTTRMLNASEALDEFKDKLQQMGLFVDCTNSSSTRLHGMVYGRATFLRGIRVVPPRRVGASGLGIGERKTRRRGRYSNAQNAAGCVTTHLNAALNLLKTQDEGRWLSPDRLLNEVMIAKRAYEEEVKPQPDEDFRTRE
jgi:dTDP-4-dehydrorhamnose reductase